jgi:hypothetical protein
MTYRNLASILARIFPTRPTTTTVVTKYQNRREIYSLTGWNIEAELMSMPMPIIIPLMLFIFAD